MQTLILQVGPLFFQYIDQAEAKLQLRAELEKRQVKVAPHTKLQPIVMWL